MPSAAEEDPDETVRRLTCPHEHSGVRTTVIRVIRHRRRLREGAFAARQTSLGSLDRVPLEIQHSILNELDLRSVLRVRRVSLRGLVVVHSLPAFDDLAEHAPHVIFVLGQTGLQGAHSMARLHEALRSDRCQCCHNYGAFLFLPTCVRGCCECLKDRPSFRVISRRDAQWYLGLKRRHVDRLPVLRTIPGNSYPNERDYPRSLPLVSAAAAKELAVAAHGSEQRLAENRRRRLSKPETIRQSSFLQRASMRPPKEDWRTRRGGDDATATTNRYVGMAAVIFPSLRTPGTVEEGTWCEGCHLAYEDWCGGLGAPEGYVPPGWHTTRFLFKMMGMAMSRAELLEHAEHCPGAQKILRAPAPDPEASPEPEPAPEAQE